MRKRVSSKQKKILVWLIVSVAIAACVAGFICFKQTHTIDLNQYLTIGYEGYNGYAEPVVILDAKALERDYGGRMQDPPESLWKESDTKGVSDRVASFCERYKDVPYGGYVYADGDVKNGNIVHYRGTDRTSYDEYFGCWVKSESFDIAAKGIKGLDDADPFEGLKIQTTGGNSEAVAEVNTNLMKSPFCYIDFQLSKSTYLSNGDTIRVTIPESDLEWLASENDGYKPKKTSQKFKVTGLPPLTSFNAESTRRAEQEQCQRAQEAQKAATEKAAEEEKAASQDSHFSNSGTGGNAGRSGNSYDADDDVDPDNPDYEEGDEDFDEYDDIEYYDDDWEGDY